MSLNKTGKSLLRSAVVHRCGFQRKFTLHISRSNYQNFFFFLLQNDQVLQGFSVDKGEFTCPLCRQFANSVLPCRPGCSTQAGAWHTPTNKKTSVLVKEVEDLQEKMGSFPVSSIGHASILLCVKSVQV